MEFSLTMALMLWQGNRMVKVELLGKALGATLLALSVCQALLNPSISDSSQRLCCIQDAYRSHNRC